MELQVGGAEWEMVSVTKRCVQSIWESDLELMILSVAWTWSLSNSRKLCKLSRLSTHSTRTLPVPLTCRAKVC
jgi:hypothetical protein